MADETYPQELKYYREHDWVRLEGEDAVFGITWFAQDALGEIVYADLPDVGDEVIAGKPYGELESVKAVSGAITSLTALTDSSSPYGLPAMTSSPTSGRSA